MRPVRLTVQAFGPFAGREEVDFREALAAGLFGIYGRTGSGKSTLFSAMTFALFGEPAKSEQEAPSLRSDHADADLPTEVEFVFDVGMKRYVALRRPEQSRPSRRGGGETRDAHEAWLFDASGMAPAEITGAARGRILAEKKVREVDAAIAEVLGYGPEQFRQIVLLPQGRFETFLSANTRDRLAILRELFDVSLYQALMADLKEEAAAAEAAVRDARAVCAGRLGAEGFESAEALAAGIGAAEALVSELAGAETGARDEARVAEAALREAVGLAKRFDAAAKAQALLDGARAREGEMEALAAQVAQADRARPLLDVEERVAEAAREAGEAGEALTDAEALAGRAAEAAEKAAKAFEREEARGPETKALRRKLDDFERFGVVLEAASGSAEAVAAALAAERAAETAFGAARDRVAGLRRRRGEESTALREARAAEARRAEISARCAGLDTAHRAAAAYERVRKQAGAARKVVARQADASGEAARRAEAARGRMEAAERALAAAQALHLAAGLTPGAPCPVCGAREHPAPAAGEAGAAGLDAAFREARDDWREADGVAREAAVALAGAQATLAEREGSLAGLDAPAESAEALAGKLAGETASLEGLGAQVDLAAAEAGIERLEAEISDAEAEQEDRRTQLDGCRTEVAGTTAAREAALAGVPEELREPVALEAARAKAAADLKALEAAREAAERAKRETREAALVAAKDCENAEKSLETCRAREAAALEAFRARLAEAGLTEAAFAALKPAIGTIEADRSRVDAFRSELRSAHDALGVAEAAIAGAVRPDLVAITSARDAAAEALGRATEARVRAAGRCDHLVSLRDSLEETLGALDAAEAASAPLRGLAALANGQNSQKLTLETYAIAAMFDRVLAAANLRLAPMTSGRYRLERELEGGRRGARGLGIRVFDLHTGKARATSTLSGGETFIAALALALGLADVVESASGRIRLDTIFIDEGFGSLDTENGTGTLDQVLQVLNGLVSQNRAVGLISHVPLVQEAIPNGFHVRKGLAGSSVELRGPV